MKVGSLVKMRRPGSQYGWRQGASKGLGIIIEAAHRTERTQRGCTVLWSDHPYADANKQTLQDIPEDWLEEVA